MSCVFCAIARGDIPSTLVYTDAYCAAFYDLSPQAPVHLLLVPRTHIESVDALTDADSGLIAHMICKIPEIARIAGLSGGYRVVANSGADAGQTVPHLHFHILGGGTLRGDFGS